MLITINDPTRNDKAEIKKNAGFLSKKFPKYPIVDLMSLSNYLVEENKPTELLIVAHGSPDKVGNLKPEELALEIKKFIQKNKIPLEKIVFHSCNTGRNWNKNSSFAERFSVALSELLKGHHIHSKPITIEAPKGMTVYYPNGEQEIIEDKNPYVVDEKLAKEISNINIDKINQAKKKVAHLLIKEEPFAVFKTTPQPNVKIQGKLFHDKNEHKKITNNKNTVIVPNTPRTKKNKKK